MDNHFQGAAAEVQRGWSNLCCLPNGRNQASSLPDLKNHPKVKYLTFFSWTDADPAQPRLDRRCFDGEPLSCKRLLGRFSRCRPLPLGRR